MTQRMLNSSTRGTECHVTSLPPLPWAAGLPWDAECATRPKQLAKRRLLSHPHMQKAKQRSAQKHVQVRGKRNRRIVIAIIKPQLHNQNKTQILFFPFHLTHTFRQVLKGLCVDLSYRPTLKK